VGSIDCQKERGNATGREQRRIAAVGPAQGRTATDQHQAAHHGKENLARRGQPAEIDPQLDQVGSRQHQGADPAPAEQFGDRKGARRRRNPAAR